MSKRQSLSKRNRYTKGDCASIDPNDVIEREEMRIKRLKMEEGKLDLLTKMVSSFRHFLKRNNDLIIENKHVMKIMERTMKDDIKSVITDLAEILSRVDKMRLKAKEDVELFSEPVVDLVCAGNRE